MGVTVEPEKTKSLDAHAIAQQRFETYVTNKLSGSWDVEKWEFYTFLLEQAKKHALDVSGLECEEYKQDRDEAIRKNRLIS